MRSATWIAQVRLLVTGLRGWVVCPAGVGDRGQRWLDRVEQPQQPIRWIARAVVLARVRAGAVGRP